MSMFIKYKMFMSLNIDDELLPLYINESSTVYESLQLPWRIHYEEQMEKKGFIIRCMFLCVFVHMPACV